ncbi:MAG: repair protein RecO protein [Parcubacteria group bacterium GW2011_GWA2_40_8]|uniref:DNA repair protein RecO n=1 Tax=Candidatus Terrybacteria bacterium RIFCSPLOWO2_01_FULL_40_23 TaxID=1802366 RepID=A0A1G2PW90_9BACT|nr:MAG: repair protein RecO protein [Parcubacteria group bacterium GW2011_GWB1_40_14]KKR77675.1 MAG: repair protein RecO protein [Parcubacteria group bacterium GW2011_GWA2_40_8]OHA52598.1 MAG: DNA repair protein RecO [Candidatus Terrybacteria bacterium RIFCSPLOWO2_01_FULL_40_23]
MDTTRAIIIRSETSGEADILITAYTEAFGKQNFVARGGRKMEAKLRPDLKPYSLVELSFVRGKNNFLLTGAKTIENFTNGAAAKDFFAASVISSIIDTFIVQPERDERLFLNILFSFRALANNSEKNSWVVVQRFFWDLLNLQGTFILSKKCRQCTNNFNYGASLTSDGELLCTTCSPDGIFNFDQEDLYAIGQILNSKSGEDMPGHVFEHLNSGLKTFLLKEKTYPAPNQQAVSWFLERVI